MKLYMKTVTSTSLAVALASGLWLVFASGGTFSAITWIAAVALVGSILLLIVMRYNPATASLGGLIHETETTPKGLRQ
jgi:hypothetical protein